jgi:hypothetical protein
MLLLGNANPTHFAILALCPTSIQRPQTSIERLELRFRNRLPIFLLSRRAGYGHGQDVGIYVHIFCVSFRIVGFLVGGTQLTPLGTAILLSLSTGSAAFTLFAVHHSQFRD